MYMIVTFSSSLIHIYFHSQIRRKKCVVFVCPSHKINNSISLGKWMSVGVLPSVNIMFFILFCFLVQYFQLIFVLISNCQNHVCTFSPLWSKYKQHVVSLGIIYKRINPFAINWTPIPCVNSLNNDGLKFWNSNLCL